MDINERVDRSRHTGILDLSYSKMGATELANLLVGISLTELDLSDNGITDDGITEIAKSLEPGLLVLKLYNNYITERGIAEVTSASLEFLDWSNNRIRTISSNGTNIS